MEYRKTRISFINRVWFYLALLFPLTALALPEDKDQEVVVVASRGGEVSLDEGITSQHYPGHHGNHWAGDYHQGRLW
jgi:hypothetical protein